MTQEAMTEYIQMRSNIFPRLDTVTLSRWEHGITSPSLAKKVELLLMIGLTINEVLEIVVKEPASTEKFNRFTADNYCGNHEELSIKRYNVFNFREADEDLDVMKTIFEDEQLGVDAFCNQEKMVFLESLIEKLRLNIWMYFHKHRLIGHLIYGEVDKNTHWRLLNKEVEFEDFVLDSESIGGVSYPIKYDHLLVFGIHCGNQKVFEHALGHMANELLAKQNPDCNLSCITHKSATANTFSKLGCSTHARGRSYTITSHDAKRSRPMINLAYNANSRGMYAKASSVPRVVEEPCILQKF